MARSSFEVMIVKADPYGKESMHEINSNIMTEMWVNGWICMLVPSYSRIVFSPLDFFDLLSAPPLVVLFVAFVFLITSL